MVKRHIWQWLLIAVIFTSGISLSIFIYMGIRASDNARVMAELQKDTYAQSIRANLLFTRAPHILNAFAALFAVSNHVSRQEFNRYANYLIKDEKEITAILWVPYVTDEQRKLYESQLAAQTGQKLGFIDIQYPAGRAVYAPKRDFYLPIYYAVSQWSEMELYGIDINGRPGNHDLRLASMEQGKELTTPVFSSIMDLHNAATIGVYYPIYANSHQFSHKLNHFMGFIVMLMTPEVLMRTEFGEESQSRFFMRLIDKDDGYRQIAINRKDDNTTPPQNLFRYNIHMPGRSWVLEIYSREHIIYGDTASFLLFCMLTLTVIITLVFNRGVRHFINLNVKNADLESQHRELKLMANFDSLTGLCNRRYFQEKVDKLLLQSVREYEIALCLLDLDNFKQINDVFGHSQGDQLLKLVADALIRETRLGDQVARIGGDEFAIALLITSGTDAVNAIMQRLQHLIPVMGNQISGNTVTISASIGITISSPAVTDYELLMRQADLAMYASKKRGKNTYTYYGAELG